MYLTCISDAILTCHTHLTVMSDGCDIHITPLCQGPGDSFQGRQGQLLWLKAMREAGVDARLCIVKDPEPPQENKKMRKRKGKEKARS